MGEVLTRRRRPVDASSDALSPTAATLSRLRRIGTCPSVDDVTNRHGGDQSRIVRDRALPLRYLMPGTALVSMGLTWPVATSHNVSYQALSRLVILAIAIGVLLLARRRWLWVIASLLAAGCLYVGVRLGGLIGITIIVIGIGIGSMALIMALDETRRIIAGRRHINWRRSFIEVQSGNDREVV